MSFSSKNMKRTAAAAISLGVLAGTMTTGVTGLRMQQVQRKFDEYPPWQTETLMQPESNNYPPMQTESYNIGVQPQEEKVVIEQVPENYYFNNGSEYYFNDGLQEFNDGSRNVVVPDLPLEEALDTEQGALDTEQGDVIEECKDGFCKRVCKWTWKKVKGHVEKVKGRVGPAGERFMWRMAGCTVEAGVHTANDRMRRRAKETKKTTTEDGAEDDDKQEVSETISETSAERYRRQRAEQAQAEWVLCGIWNSLRFVFEVCCGCGLPLEEQ